MNEITTSSSLGKLLLKEKDYILVEWKDNRYLFLPETLQYFKVTSPAVENYLQLCRSQDMEHTPLTAEEIADIGRYLTPQETEEPAAIPETGHNFLILSVTGGCNLACKYCFAEIAGSRKSMRFETAKKAIDNMLGQPDRFDDYSIFFFGGEPLLKKKLIKQVVEYAHEEATLKAGKKVRFLINTNATLIDREAIDLFGKYDFKVTVSLDGPLEYHDLNRVYANGKGSFEKVMENILLLKENRIHTDLRATFNPNTPELVGLFRFLESLQLPYSYSFTINSEYKLNLKETFFEENQFEIVDKELRKVMDFFFAKLKNKETVYYVGLNQKLYMLRYRRKRAYSCEAGRRSMTVDEEGNYYACQNRLPYKQTVMGDVETGIAEDRKLQFRSQSLSTLDECRQCTIRNLCAGGCGVERNNPNPQTRQQMCRLSRIEWKNFLYIYALLMEAKKN